MGNNIYSWWVKDGEPVIEYEAKDVSGTQVENPYMDVISQYEPIPLTEEWLLKFGGTYKSYGYGDNEWKSWNINGFPFRQNGNGITFTLGDNDIDYVHELQNLFYVLKKELKLK
jgi:hypothetical protein